jgi:nucleoside-diphosphate-sugar epimerase
VRIPVTGGAGFIGSALVRQLAAETDHHICVVDNRLASTVTWYDNRAWWQPLVEKYDESAMNTLNCGIVDSCIRPR